jgi:endonuclease YncB( thermonuclease family)
MGLLQWLTEPRRRKRWRPPRSLHQLAVAVVLGVAATTLFAFVVQRGGAQSLTISGGPSCSSPRVVDGDTLRCGDMRVRLSGIDAPELEGHCNPGRTCTPGDGNASRARLEALVKGAAIECQQTDIDRYGRTVARCTANGRDLSCAQVHSGFAVRRYEPLSC